MILKSQRSEFLILVNLKLKYPPMAENGAKDLIKPYVMYNFGRNFGDQK